MVRFHCSFTVILSPTLVWGPSRRVPTFLGWSCGGFSTGSKKRALWELLQVWVCATGSIHQERVGLAWDPLGTPSDHLLLHGFLSTGCSVEICSAVVRHGLWGDSLLRQGPLCGPQGGFGSSTWSASCPPSALTLVSAGRFLTPCSPNCCCAAFFFFPFLGCALTEAQTALLMAGLWAAMGPFGAG